MIVPLLNPTGGRRRTSRRVALLVGVGLLSTGLTTLPAQAGTPVEAGYADHTYGTVTDGVTAHTSQSKLWFHDGIWWAVMMEPEEAAPVAHENRWAIYRFDVPSQTWLSTKVQVDERNQSHPDVLSVGNSVYVVSSYSRFASEAVKVYKFNYDAGSKSYALDELFRDADPRLDKPGRYDDGVETQARGIQFATIAQVDTDTLAIAYTSSNEVYYMTSDMQAVDWSAPQALGTGTRAPIADPPGPETASSDDIAVAVGDGAGTAGIMWSRTSTLASPYGGFYFAPWTGSGFGPIEDAWHGDAIGDNHVSAKLEGDRLLVAVKTSLKGPDDVLVSVLRREGPNNWSNHPVITRKAGGVKQDATRPVLVLDDAQAHVLMTDKVDGGAIYRNSAPLGSLAFTNGMGSAFIKDAAHPNINDTTTTKQLMPAGTGIVAQASDDVDGRDRYFHGCTAGSCPAGGVVAPPPTPTKPTTTSLTTTPNPSVAGGPVTLRAAVSGGPGIGGSVSFLDGATVIKTVALSNGVASTVTSFSAGRYSLKAVYNGDSTYLGSGSSVIIQRAEAASTASGGPSGIRAVAPAGTRLSVVSPPRRVVSAKKLGPGKSTVVALPAPSDLSAAAVNVTVQAGKKATAVAVCRASQSVASCKSAPLLKVGKRAKAARFAVAALDGPRLRLYNSAGKARITVDVQGWFVPDASKLKLSALASPARVVKGAKVTAAKPYALRIPASLRPAGTKAVQLNLAAAKPSTRSVLSACKAKATRASCLSRPTLFTKRGGTATNRVIVPVSKNGTVRLVNGSGSVKVSVWVSGVFTTG